MEALDRKVNAKKLLSVNYFKNKFNLEANGSNNLNFNNNFENDSPSNKIISLKILTFGHNCNFPGGNPDEELYEEIIENNLNVDKYNKSIKNKKQEELDKKQRAEVASDSAVNNAKLLNKKIVIKNKNNEGLKEGMLPCNQYRS